MAPRGLSAEEKRVKLLEIFHESKDFFQLKELEKLGPKLKGIVSQSVKEVLQSLVDDGLVSADKIGSSNFFWSFPSQRGALAQARLDIIKEACETSEAQLAETRTAIETEKAARPESEERRGALEQLEVKKQEYNELERELGAYGACDPAKVEEKKRGQILAHDAAIRWTDNYSVVASYFTRQNNVDPADLRKYLEIGEDYEDIC
ncbi:meiotic nuclear division protein 1 [Athelia psychrophila]|uniref:Meiotic nuclear division protein 1 n=1 Tax=Athelia psychrophila TaxID=1759441 RepID=A0A166X862_9AGAM|nr:meiotic nuclear division protein 1 [Fibularhizoctonia sp. CBS 109695]